MTKPQRDFIFANLKEMVNTWEILTDETVEVYLKNLIGLLNK